MKQKKLYISVISHGHERLIVELGALKRLNQHKNITVICCDNSSNQVLADYCLHHGIDYVASNIPRGFAYNNNRNFVRALELGMQPSDHFLLYNPDVDISDDHLDALLVKCQEHDLNLATIDLRLDEDYRLSDDNLRRYPNFITFVKNYCLKDRSTVINKNNLQQIEQQTFWASGAFLLFKARLYAELKGLDERFFLYCEDVDVCRRALDIEYPIQYLGDIRAVHYRQCKSRRFLSREFFLHVKSVFQYGFSSSRNLQVKSQLSNVPFNKDWV
ncbi:glycosyltransferase family 2 protein [Vibrio sp. B1FLJ16]|uniref:glycosyltransferase family 2 protein n=1 Tax=Vibrio sp. B1FLJ16 TaxID=2751178 RepID=UPI0015F3CDE6|nr:glycosyltransferase family 2 protein [Vibrio sp. B1FLJ16]CAD7807384.1 Rhamnosyltransferase WbbL [Vibrio sp. B1FLJ16]CAE6905501.1 Rhamnosyltransferase WbbL [Vibrio sp. B1FLJ16]